MLRFSTTKRHLLVEMPFVLFHIVAFGGVTRSSLRTPDSPFHSRVITLDIGKIQKASFLQYKGKHTTRFTRAFKLIFSNLKVNTWIFFGVPFFLHIVNILSYLRCFFLLTYRKHYLGSYFSYRDACSLFFCNIW